MRMSRVIYGLAALPLLAGVALAGPLPSADLVTGLSGQSNPTLQSHSTPQSLSETDQVLLPPNPAGRIQLAQIWCDTEDEGGLNADNGGKPPPPKNPPKNPPKKKDPPPPSRPTGTIWGGCNAKF